MHCSAGLFGGDELECSIRVQRGAQVLLTQQSATKVHPTLGPPATQRHRVFVESGAELQLYFEPVIPFAGASLMQSIRIDLEENARLVFWEGLMAGRIGRGERWQFQKLASEIDLRLNGKRVYLERFILPDGLERSDYAMGECNYLGTGLYVGDRASEFAACLHTAVPDVGVDMLARKVAIMRRYVRAAPIFIGAATCFAPDLMERQETNCSLIGNRFLSLSGKKAAIGCSIRRDLTSEKSAISTSVCFLRAPISGRIFV
jgi:hypothetical protein